MKPNNSREKYISLLQSQKQKQCALFAIVGKENFYAVCTIVGLLSVWAGLAYWNYATGRTVEDTLLGSILASVFVALWDLIGLIVGLIIIFGIVLILHDLFTIEIPVLLNRRYLPLTQEEICELDLSPQEFAEFVETVSSNKKGKFSKYILPDIAQMIHGYAYTRNMSAYDIINLCSSEFQFHFDHNEGRRYL